ncbi:MAG: hypothetical protein ABSG24_08255 [Acidimicrobiales bacterium]
MARTRAQRRRHSFWLGVAAVITLLVLLFARDVTRAAHNSLSPRRSENRSFAALASSLIAQENNLDLRLRYLLNNGESLSRAVFAARLTQLSDQLVLWPTESEQLYRPVLAHDVNDILAQEVSTRFADYEVIFTDVVESLHLPPATLPWPTGDMNILNTNAAQSSLLSTSKQWNTRRWSLAHEPGRVVLDATSNGVALSPLSSDIGALRSSSNLAATRGVGIAAVAVTPSPLPAPSGELLLPPVKAVHVGVSVINGNYIEQPITLTVTIVPMNHRGLRQSQTMHAVLGPLQSYAFVPRLLETRASERATLIIKVAGAPNALNMTRSRIYSVVMSPSGTTKS